MKITRHQTQLYKLVKQHQPVIIQSRNPHDTGDTYPRYMLDMTIWANSMATRALERKGLIKFDEKIKKWIVCN